MSRQSSVRQAHHALHSRGDLLAFLAAHAEGVHFGDIKDTYRGIAEDVEKLRANGKVIAWKHHETEEWVLFPKDDPPRIAVDADLAAEWLRQPVRPALPLRPTLTHSDLRLAPLLFGATITSHPMWYAYISCLGGRAAFASSPGPQPDLRPQGPSGSCSVGHVFGR